MASILFTKSNTIGSNLIRWVTDEPVSHVALRIGQSVYHSKFGRGITREPLEKFREKNVVVYRVTIYNAYFSGIERYTGGYDYLALLFLGLRYLLPFLPKVNLWQVTGMYLCTEYITKLINKEEDSMITPYQLYNELRSERNY